MLEGVVGGAVGDGQRRGALEVEISGELDDLARRDRRAFARRVEVGVAHDAVAGLELGNPGAHALDHARELAAGRERERRLGLVFPGDDQGVEEIESDRRDLGHDLARSGNRVGHIPEYEVFGCAVTFTKNGFHGWTTRAGSERQYGRGGAGRTPTDWYCAWDIYIAASVARAAEFAFTLPNSPS